MQPVSFTSSLPHLWIKLNLLTFPLYLKKKKKCAMQIKIYHLLKSVKSETGDLKFRGKNSIFESSDLNS